MIDGVIIYFYVLYFMKKLITIFSFVLFKSSISFGQIEKILHQDFNVDRITTVEFDLARDYYLEKWSGTTILVETKIKLGSATPSIMKYALESGRYEILLLEDGEKVTMKSKLSRPPRLKNKNNEITEEIEVKIMVPEDFNTDDIKIITRKEDTNSSTIKIGE